MSLVVRRGGINDIAKVMGIYNHYVEHSYSTFELEPWQLEEKQSWFIQNFKHMTEEHTHLFHHHHPADAESNHQPENVLLVCSEMPPEIDGEEEKLMEDDKVVGYAWFSSYREHKKAYSRTKETSVFVHPNHQRNGIATMLYKQLIVDAREAGVHALLAITGGSQPALAALHNRFAFEKVGHLRETGFKFNQWHDNDIYQLLL